MTKNLQFHFLNTLRQTLDEILLKGYHADRMIDKYVRANPKWSSDERALFAHSVYEILRHKRLLEFLSESPEILPLAAVYFLKEGYKLPPRAELADLDFDRIQQRLRMQKPLEVESSLPDWLNELGERDFKNRWPRLARELCVPPKLYLRLNRLKTDRERLLSQFKKEKISVLDKIKCQISVPDALEIRPNQNIFVTEAYRQGLFEVQDIGSQFIAPLLQLEPGQTVIDACAGSGGKSLHIVALLKNQGQVIALDIKGHKLKDLQIRADKAGCKILKTQLIDSDECLSKPVPKLISQFEKTADRLLLDVPCSGLGVLKRNPDSKWKMSPEQVGELCQTQKKILQSYTRMCKPGGITVYATCSLLRQENEEQIAGFLQQSPAWELLSEQRVWPDENSSDGFYAAVLRRKPA
jgi:16S rRNA (cytosine967-C5)-methyltransferase